MFLLPSLVLGLVLAVALGGKPERILSVRFRTTWAIPLAFAIQIFLFTSAAAHVPARLHGLLHVSTYLLLLLFAAANVRVRGLSFVLLGTLANAAAIIANGGSMPVSPEAAEAAGVSLQGTSNVSAHADRLSFLGDVFALPSALPFGNVFSLGDLLIGFGMVAFLVIVSLDAKGEPPLRLARIATPLTTVSFRRLALGRLISQTGDWLTMVGLIGWVYQTTGSTTHVAGLLLVRLAPPILGGAAAAFVVDRLPKRTLLVGIEWTRGAAVLLALAGVLTGSRLIVFLAIGISGALAALSEALLPALVPSILQQRQYAAGNSLLGMVENVAMVIGSLCAGLAVSFVGIEPALILDALSFVFAAGIFLFVQPRLVASEAGENRRARSGLRYLLSRRRLLILVLAFAAATLATGLANATLPRFLEERVGLGPGGYGFGFAALAAGLALGKASVGFTRAGQHGSRWIGCALILMAGLFVVLGLSDHAPTVLVILGLIGFVDGTTDVIFDTIVQNEAEPAYYGSVFGVASATYMSTMMIAIALAPAANSVLAANELLIAVCVFLATAGAIAFAFSGESPANRARAGPVFSGRLSTGQATTIGER